MFPRFYALIVCAFACAAVASAQQPPSSPCEFSGFDVSARLAEVAKPTTAYYACGAGKKCLTMQLRPSDTVVISRSEGEWTCGYATTSRGAAQGWVRSQDIRAVTADPNPPLTAWLGDWVQGENRIAIKRSRDPAQLSLDGQAYWRGSRDNVHDGSIAGEAAPQGNRLHYAEASPDSCTVDFALIGNYLLASDNNKCGGMNVRFWGVWQRSAAPRRTAK